MTVGGDQLGDLALVVTKSSAIQRLETEERCGGRLAEGETTTLSAGTELFFVDGQQGLLGERTSTGVRLFAASGRSGTSVVVNS